VLGVAGLLASTKHRSARVYGGVLAVVGIGLFVIGAVSIGRPDLNVLDLNWAANVLHLVTGLIGLAVAAVAVRGRAQQASRTPEPGSGS
jgi:hypothetical protein